LILPGVSTQIMSIALAEFVKAINPNNDKTIILLLDNAGWHTSNDLIVPPGLVLLNIPPYTPKLSPAETIVPLIREAAANQSFDSLDALQATLDKRCVYLLQNPLIISTKANFHWQPQ
jgi:transposase